MRYLSILCMLVFIALTPYCYGQGEESLGSEDEYTYASGEGDYFEESPAMEEAIVWGEEYGYTSEEEAAPVTESLPEESSANAGAAYDDGERLY